MIHDLYIHGITSIKISEQVRKTGEDEHYKTPPYFSRKIIITDNRGVKLTIYLFGDRETDLEFKDA